jgi:hypothetical protein
MSYPFVSALINEPVRCKPTRADLISVACLHVAGLSMYQSPPCSTCQIFMILLRATSRNQLHVHVQGLSSLPWNFILSISMFCFMSQKRQPLLLRNAVGVCSWPVNCRQFPHASCSSTSSTVSRHVLLCCRNTSCKETRSLSQLIVQLWD